MFPRNSIISETRVETIEGGTKLTRKFASGPGPFLGRAFVRIFSLFIGGTIKKSLTNFKDTIESEYQAQQTSPDRDVDITEEQIREAASKGLTASSEI